MTAATQDIDGARLGTDDVPMPQLLALPAEANKIVYAGTLAASNAAGNCVDAGDTGALFIWGRCRKQVDNRTSNVPFGAAGAQQVTIETGCFYFAHDGTVTAASVGQAAYAVDNCTVSTSSAGTAGVRPYVGTIMPPGLGIAGASPGGAKVPVSIDSSVSVGTTLRYTVLLPLATIQTFTSGTAFNVGFPLPANARLESAQINVLTALSGGGASAVAATLQGGSDAAGTIIASSSVFTGAAAVIATPGSNPYPARGGQQIKMTLTDTGGTLAALTAGSLSVDIFYTIVP